VGPGTRRAVSVWYVEPLALTLRTDDELERALDLLCEQEGLSRQELIRRAVLERLERSGHRERVDAAAERAVSRWGDVLDRLGTV
jgi:predicted transcriptional regulator